MKGTDFPYIMVLQDSLPNPWRIPEIINYGRSKDKEFYPVSKKGSEEHVNVMHAANVLYVLAFNASKATIDRALKNRYLLRSQRGKYFLNELAELLRDRENFAPEIWDSHAKASIEQILISLDRPYVEVHRVYQPPEMPGLTARLKDLQDLQKTQTDTQLADTNKEIHSIEEKVKFLRENRKTLIDTYSSGSFERRGFERFTVISHRFLDEYAMEIRKKYLDGRDVDPKELAEMNRSVDRYRRIEQ